MLLGVLLCKMGRVRVNIKKMKPYSFWVCFDDKRDIEIFSANNSSEALILAQAERIKSGRNYSNWTVITQEYEDGWKIVRTNK